MHLPHQPRHRRRTVRSVVVGTLAATALAVTGSLAALGGSQAASAAPVLWPPTAASAPAGLSAGLLAVLPSDIEGLAKYVPADSCDPHAKPGTTALADLLVRTYGSFYGIDRTCGTDPLPTSEHYDGRAIDFFRSVKVRSQRADITDLVNWLFATDAQGHQYANARRLGVMYLIWDNKIWGSYRASDGWRPYSSCASHPSSAYDTTCHRDHIHISLSWEGAMKRTSFWTDKVAATDYGPCREAGLNWAAPYTAARSTPCPSYSHVSAPAGASALRRTLTTYSGMQLQSGDTGPVVAAVQSTVGTTADGSYGTRTAAAVSAWQSAHGVARTGVVDADTWRTLLTAAPVKAAAGPVAHPELTKYRHRILRPGSNGPAVTAVKRRLGIHPPGTHFGPRTRTRVLAFQRSHGVPTTGNVGPLTWAALGA
jgi:hypothetical protein